MTTIIVDYITAILAVTGYPGLVFAMALESMIFPIPSEAIMPFAGFLWYSGEMTLLGIAWWSMIGSLIGSLFSYWLGYYGGRRLVLRFGHYLLLNEEHLKKTEEFFAHSGEKAVFFSRFIPIVRHLISIPAGIGKMNLWKFVIYTAIGAFLWNDLLAIIGYYLGQNWEIIKEYGNYMDIIVVVGMVAVAIWFWWRKRRS